jgi:hypothetical protein
MKRIYRVALAVGLTILMMTIAVGAWAAGRAIGGTVPNGNNCSGGSPVIFSDANPDAYPKIPCKFSEEYIKPGIGEFYSPIYIVEPGGTYVCFAYPPAFAHHNVGIYFYNDVSWKVADYKIVDNPAQICASLPVGSLFALIGNK